MSLPSESLTTASASPDTIAANTVRAVAGEEQEQSNGISACTLHDILKGGDDDGSVDWDAFLRRLSSHPGEAIREIRPRKGGRDGPIRWVLQKRPPPNVVEKILCVHGKTIVATYSRPEGHSALEQALDCEASGENIRLICEAKPEAVRATHNGLDRMMLPIHQAKRAEHVRVLQEFYPDGIINQCHLNGMIPLSVHVGTLVQNRAAAPHELDLIRASIEEGMLLHECRGIGDPTGGALAMCPSLNGSSLLKYCIDAVLEAETETGERISQTKAAFWSILELLVQAVSCARTGGLRRLFEEKAKSISGAQSKLLIDESFWTLHRDEVFARVFSPDFLFLKAHIEFVGGGWGGMTMSAIGRYRQQIPIPDKDGNLPLSIAAMKNAPPFIIFRLVEHYAAAASIPNKKGRLALHFAAESGLLHSGLDTIVQAYPEALAIQDVTTGLYPFMIAAMGNHTDTAFALLLDKPDLLNAFV